MTEKHIIAIGIKRKDEDHFTTIGEVDAIYNGKPYKLTVKKYKKNGKWRLQSPPFTPIITPT